MFSFFVSVIVPLLTLVSEHLEFTRLTSSVNTSVPTPQAAITLPPPCLTDDVCALGHELFCACSILILAIILVELDFGLICPTNVFPGLRRLFKMFISNVQSSLWIREVAWISIQHRSLGWLL